MQIIRTSKSWEAYNCGNNYCANYPGCAISEGQIIRDLQYLNRRKVVKFLHKSLFEVCVRRKREGERKHKIKMVEFNLFVVHSYIDEDFRKVCFKKQFIHESLRGSHMDWKNRKTYSCRGKCQGIFSIKYRRKEGDFGKFVFLFFL